MRGFFITHTGKLLSQTSIMDLMRWSADQTENPTEKGVPDCVQGVIDEYSSDKSGT